VRIRPFGLERFFARWEFSTDFSLSSSDCETLSVARLLALEPGAQERLLELQLGYPPVEGSAELRSAAATSYERVEDDDVLVVAAAEEGIFLAYHALLGPGDHAIVETPCYASAVEVARSAGADVSCWQRRDADAWGYDLERLAGLLRPDTKLLYVNTPHNPTGSQMPRETFDGVMELAAERSLIVLSDEVYAGLEHDPERRLPAACDRYENAISLNAVSKAYGLPGLRVAWMASRNHALLEPIADLKLYTTICSSAPGELLAAIALRHRETLTRRTRKLVADNLAVADDLVERRDELISWVRPVAGSTGLVRVADEIDVDSWCGHLAEHARVLLLPGSVFDEPRHVRLGLGRRNFGAAIARLDDHLDGRPR